MSHTPRFLPNPSTNPSLAARTPATTSHQHISGNPITYCLILRSSEGSVVRLGAPLTTQFETRTRSPHAAVPYISRPCRGSSPRSTRVLEYLSEIRETDTSSPARLSADTHAPRRYVWQKLPEPPSAYLPIAASRGIRVPQTQIKRVCHLFRL